MQKLEWRTEKRKVKDLIPYEQNPRTITDKQMNDLKKSIRQSGYAEIIVIDTDGKIVAGNQRHRALVEMEMLEQEIDVRIPNRKLSKEEFDRYLVASNALGGDWDIEKLKLFEESFLSEIGFSSEDLDDIFAIEETPEEFNLEAELKKLKIDKVTIQKGDVYDLNGSRLMCGDSTVESDVLKLMDGEKADMCLTDPPYILNYLKGKKRKGKATEGFGLKRDRKYLETDVLPDNFTELWMANVAKVQKPDFSIIVFENPKNLRTIWNALETHWRYRNTITWRLPNRVQGFAAKYHLFNKTDIALVGTGGDVTLNLEPESDELLQNEYENAIFATSGKPHYEQYEKGKKYCPTDFIDYKSADEKSSGQGIIFGTKPIEILVPYIKVLTKRDDLILEIFGGSGSTLVAATKMKRRCFVLEKVPTYTEVIKNRWEKLTGLKAKKLQ